MTPSPRGAVLPPEWSRSKLAVVIPTYNEADTLPALVKHLFALPLPGLTVIVVDDNSPDGTGAIADDLAAVENQAGENEQGQDRMIVLHRPGKAGIGRAHAAGMLVALERGFDYVAQMDADLSHPPEAIPGMLGTLRSLGAGVVIGSRYVSGGSLSSDWGRDRRFLSAFANFYVNAILALRIRDVTAGFKVWRSDVLAAIDLAGLRSDGYSFQVEMNYRCASLGYVAVEVPIHFEERLTGASKMGFVDKWESMKLPFILRRHNRLQAGRLQAGGRQPVTGPPRRG
ncbi:MAG: polyprenol monophosphomannose synthase [Pseudonocardiaceae bacterium]